MSLDDRSKFVEETPAILPVEMDDIFNSEIYVFPQICLHFHDIDVASFPAGDQLEEPGGILDAVTPQLERGNDRGGDDRNMSSDFNGPMASHQVTIAGRVG